MNSESKFDFTSQLKGDTETADVAPVVESKSPTFKLSVTKKQGKQDSLTVKDEEGNLPKVAVAGVPAVIRVTGGRTINLGNFNSAKIEVSLSYPVAVDDIEAGWDFCYAWVDAKLSEALEEDTPDQKGL